MRYIFLLYFLCLAAVNGSAQDSLRLVLPNKCNGKVLKIIPDYHNSYLVVVSERAIKINDLRSMKEIYEIANFTHNIRDIKISHKGNFLAIATEPTNRKQLHVVNIHYGNY